ncbi:MAG: hypothetical protein GOMPHAMPRED_001880 [Gomphillus americanus]|uniref:Fatty acid hydroxylase domain-containing protein n=1 Tax=Gomphillus americanus TaxID=1940652 RepID=A0A8H3FBW3_9LECA|nr:MAG: hypothetical protein GOMPHAMPRED_001880 [Gomphillus americanus]
MASSQNPKDSMKSTWAKDKSQWRLPHYVCSVLDPFTFDPSTPYPVFKKTDPVPTLTHWSMNAFILVHCLWPMALQYVYYRYTGHNIHPILAYLLYSFAFKFNSAHQLVVLRRLALKYGFYDGDVHERDHIPDVGVDKAFSSVQLTTSIRPLYTLLMTYNSTAPPAFSWTLPIELALYSIVLDFWFYIYHRACHEVDFLWRYHRTHHLTKHPTPFLSAYADSEQEFIEIALVPILTWGTLRLLGFPMGFYDWWVCHQYIIFSEAFGHSGLRIFSTAPGTSFIFLRLGNAELTGEDHDLHHRKGYRKSANYGKQTRLWDVIFGTTWDRIESVPSNIDHNTIVNFPLV